MGGPGTWSVRRGVAFAAVVALHAGLVITLTLALRPPTRSSSQGNFVSTLIFLSTPVPPAASARRRSQIATGIAPLAPVEPLNVPPPQIDFPIGADTSIDWSAEARRAATAVTSAPNFREFGRSPKADLQQGAHPAAAHTAGEQYRDEDGEWIVWVSDRCYIVSGIPPLGLPDILAHSIPTRSVCQGDSGPRSDLFKDLPAYKKYHPQ
jgi:hypothetical protein